jgi:hypothetical protein
MEILVVNPTTFGLELAFEGRTLGGFAWSDTNGLKIPAADSILIGPRGWILAKSPE